MLSTVVDLNRAYAGKPVWVILTGTSLRGFNWSRLVGEVTIGCNDAVLHMRPTLHLVNDRHLVKRYKDRSPWRDAVGRDRLSHPSYPSWRYQDGQQVVCNVQCLPHFHDDQAVDRIHIYSYYRDAKPNTDVARDWLWCNTTVAVTAIELAWRIGASEINILGLDCYRRGPYRYWWQPFDETHVRHIAETRDEHVEDLTVVRDWLLRIAPGLPVVSYSADSACDVWPKRDWHTLEEIETCHRF